METKNKIYPNYSEQYYYCKGGRTIILETCVEEKVVSKRNILLNSIEEAQEYFNNNCGV